MSDADNDLATRFIDYYAGSTSPAVRALEERTLGAGYGGNSYTTAVQALDLAALLGLKPGGRLLEVGAGAGWPGVFLAQERGYHVVLTDPPLEGLLAARSLAQEKSVDGCSYVAASGSRLPFRTGSFDAVSHSDVLC